MAIDSATLDVLLKVSLALFGAAIGAALTNAMHRRRLRALLPLVIVQVRAVVASCADAYSVGEANVAVASIDAASRLLTEVIGVGLRPAKVWREGAILLQKASQQASVVNSAKEAALLDALEQLRANAMALRLWVATAEKTVQVGVTN